MSDLKPAPLVSLRARLAFSMLAGVAGYIAPDHFMAIVIVVVVVASAYAVLRAKGWMA